MLIPSITYLTPPVSIAEGRELSDERYMIYALPITLIYSSKLSGISEFAAMGAVNKWAVKTNNANTDYDKVSQLEYRCWLSDGYKFGPIINKYLYNGRISDKLFGQMLNCQPTMIPRLKLFLKQHKPKKISVDEWFRIYNGLPYTIKHTDSGVS